MKVELTGEESAVLKKQFALQAVRFIQQELENKGCVFPSKDSLLVIACVSGDAIRKLNQQFRGKDKVTDILSFAPVEEESLGELALCMPQVEIQAQEHGLTVEEETFYLILHGILHLLGYNHEKGGKQAREMYAIQDEVFEEWRKQQ
ncbi:MAG: rRNA maturation RNase YbeY [Bdellovibrionales bacterium]|nr:rRNA maturation RNase YbeY [Bdellovibrionales bacterium]